MLNLVFSPLALLHSSFKTRLALQLEILAWKIQCAVERRRFSVGAKPTRQLSLQPVAIGGVEEVTNLLKPSV